jgi:hypothetical protein
VSLWLQILELTAAGDSLEAQRLLAELPFVLRYPEVIPSGGTEYKGPVANAVRAFISKLPKLDRGMAESRFEDFVDYVTDLIQASVRRTLSLVEFCLANPELSVEQMGEQFVGWSGIKRGSLDRQRWIRRHLCSMLSAGVRLPITIAETVQSNSATSSEKDDELYGFSEIALSKKWDLGLSWRDFKSRQELDTAYMCIEEEPAGDAGVGDEKADYGSITTAQVVLALSTPSISEFQIDLDQMGKTLTGDLCELLRTFDAEKPTDGYSPIAWHSVWWYMTTEYEAMPLALESRDPECNVDRELAEYIQEHYPAVLSPSRVTILRRRSKFQGECVDRVQSLLMDWAQNRGGPTSHS